MSGMAPAAALALVQGSDMHRVGGVRLTKRKRREGIGGSKDTTVGQEAREVRRWQEEVGDKGRGEGHPPRLVCTSSYHTRKVSRMWDGPGVLKPSNHATPWKHMCETTGGRRGNTGASNFWLGNGG